MLVNVRIKRSEGNAAFFQSYSVDVTEKRTVLGVLLEIYAQKDPSLAFRFGCRFKHCGLCAMNINGRSYPSCLYEVKGDLELGPLTGLPVLQDLVIDRLFYSDLLKNRGVYLPLPPAGEEITEYNLYKQLLGCTECYCCLSECPRFVADNTFPGPLFYVKLAQIYLNPYSRRSIPDISQKELQECLDCLKCVCPYNVPVSRTLRLLGENFLR